MSEESFNRRPMKVHSGTDSAERQIPIITQVPPSQLYLRNVTISSHLARHAVRKELINLIFSYPYVPQARECLPLHIVGSRAKSPFMAVLHGELTLGLNVRSEWEIRVVGLGATVN